MMEMRKDNDITNPTSLLYIENETKLSRLIRQDVIYNEKQTEKCVVYDQDKTRQLHDPLYRFALHRKWK